jgi:precorrin-6Y C5,15-methyltransferase (decarboxylating)
MDIEDHQLIAENAKRFGVENLRAILGKAPEAWADLPTPDAIFVGGTGRQVSQIVQQAMQRLRPGGHLVANVGSIDNAAAVRQMLAGQAADDQLWMINIARGVYQLERVRLESINPTFLIRAVKQG